MILLAVIGGAAVLAGGIVLGVAGDDIVGGLLVSLMVGAALAGVAVWFSVCFAGGWCG